ncbi:unnamed protein product [Linum trigynum]|uniref:Uncharacterized protein n=1 Tax=Linum trigynum TaxID=586398 RepID=A0AAV2DS89_9ROSI
MRIDLNEKDRDNNKQRSELYWNSRRRIHGMTQIDSNHLFARCRQHRRQIWDGRRREAGRDDDEIGTFILDDSGFPFLDGLFLGGSGRRQRWVSGRGGFTVWSS